MIVKMMIGAATLLAATPTLAQSDPFAGMSEAGRAKATTLNQQIGVDASANNKAVGDARIALKAALSAKPLDMTAVREAARRFDEAYAGASDYTLRWVELAATLDPADRMVVLGHLPTIGGVIRPRMLPPPPPMPPASYRLSPFLKATPTPPAPAVPHP